MFYRFRPHPACLNPHTLPSVVSFFKRRNLLADLNPPDRRSTFGIATVPLNAHYLQSRPNRRHSAWVRLGAIPQPHSRSRHPSVVSFSLSQKTRRAPKKSYLLEDTPAAREKTPPAARCPLLVTLGRTLDARGNGPGPFVLKPSHSLGLTKPRSSP